MIQEGYEDEAHHADTLCHIDTGFLCGGDAFWFINLYLAARRFILYVLQLPIVGSVGADEAINVCLSEESKGEECGQEGEHGGTGGDGRV